MGQGWSRNYPESLGTWVLTGNPCGVSCAHRFPENVLTHCTTIYWIVSVLSKLNSQRRTSCSYRSATRDVFPRFLRKLAQRKHFPAINWNISFSKYIRSRAFKVLHSLICRVQAAEKEYFPCIFGLLICKQKQQILFGTKQPLHGKVFWSHTSRSMTQSTATWQLEETCDLSSLRTFFMSHDWNNFHFVPLPQSCTCRYTVWVPQALEMHIPPHVSPCVR